MTSRRGFTLIECAGAVLLGGVVLSIFQPVMGDARRGARMQTSQDNLRFWGVASGTYTSDFGGLMPAYSWRDGECYNVAGFGNVIEGGDVCMPPDSSSSNSNNRQAVTFQETDLLRRLTGRVVGDGRIRILASIFPQRRRTHLIMADHMGLGPVNERAVDPQDRLQLLWQRDPIAFEQSGDYPQPSCDEGLLVGQNSDDPIVQRWAYSSSYRVVPASFSHDGGLSTTVGPTDSTSNLFTVGVLPLGNRNASEVAFPAQKVFMYEWHDRHSSDQGLWYAYPQAKPNKLMFDGSVNAFATGDAGVGADPNNLNDPEPATYRYCPLTTEPPPVGDPNALYPVSFRWTRYGLAGIDYTP